MKYLGIALVQGYRLTVGRFVAAASLVIERDDVFDARIAFVGTTASRRRKTSFFTSSFSVTASMTMSAAEKRWKSVVSEMRPSVSCF